MKRKILSLVFAAAMLLGFVVSVEGGSGGPCGTYVLTCGSDGSQHYVIVCDEADQDAWVALLCER